MVLLAMLMIVGFVPARCATLLSQGIFKYTANAYHNTTMDSTMVRIGMIDDPMRELTQATSS
jgi:hypothetical protein